MAQGNEFVTSGSIAADGSFTDAFNQTYDSEQYPVGTLRYQAADEVTASDASLGGDRLWMFVKASSAGVSANDLLERDSTSTAFQVKTSSATNDLARILVVGVALHHGQWFLMLSTHSLQDGYVTSLSLSSGI